MIEGALIKREGQKDSLRLHVMVKWALLQSLDDSRICLLFDSILFMLNAKFPRMEGGKFISDEWERCAVYHHHVLALVDVYERFSSILRPPILLCELIRRCAWQVYNNHLILSNSVQVSLRDRPFSGGSQLVEIWLQYFEVC